MESLRPIGSLKSTLSGRSTPRNSPTFRRLNSSRTPRREGRSSGGSGQWLRSNRIVLWLLLITLWAYGGFYVQSRWAHGDNKGGVFGFGSEPTDEDSDSGHNVRRDLLADDDSLPVKNVTTEKQSNLKKIDVVLTKNGDGISSRGNASFKKKSKKSARGSRRKKTRGKQKAIVVVERIDNEEQEEDIPKTNTSYGLLVGPFDSTEDRTLEWSPEKRSGTCDRKGEFARLVWSRKFVLIFHELSMTGAPLSMMELATELLSCGATVSAVVLSKKGGLMPELARRKITVLDKTDHSFKTAMKADLVVAGSAVCASWIEQFLSHSMSGSSKIAWWIMENRREYFNRTKPVLNRVKTLIFLSELQLKQWLAWCEEENIKLNSQTALVPLSINDELAFVAGISCSLNTPSSSTENMLEKRKLLRNAVREEMGLKDNDMLVISLSSINPGKGQFLLLESLRLMVEQESSQSDSVVKAPVKRGQRQSTLAGGLHSRALLHYINQLQKTSNGSHVSKESSLRLGPKNENSQLANLLTTIDNPDNNLFNSDINRRELLSQSDGMKGQTLKVLIGSVGSKSNKVPYVKALLSFVSHHSNLSKSVLWTPATARVAALYSAADVYVINSQGLGETFGRVTIEAMGFGLPVLGTDAGGTKEIVVHNVTGLLHPPGRPGSRDLAENLRFFLENPLARQQMGMRGREKVEKMYLKRHMYKKLAQVLIKCMRIK